MPRVFHGRIVLLLILALGWDSVMLWDSATSCDAQDAVSEKESVGDEDSVNRLVNRLRSDSFVVREQAMSELYDMGAPAIGLMRERLAAGLDPESTHRLSEVIRRLAEKDLNTLLDQFLSGEDVSLDGWKWTSERLGDNNVIRDTFVLMMQHFPEAVALLDNDSRGRSQALQLLIAKIKPSLAFDGKAPSPVACLVLLLPIMDKDVPITKEVDEMVLLLMKRFDQQRLLEDKTLSEPYRFLINGWAMRSSPGYRATVLQIALQLELSCELDLAINTLELVTRLNEELALAAKDKDSSKPDDQVPASHDPNDSNPIPEKPPAVKREPLKGNNLIAATQLNQTFTIACALQALARRGSIRQVEFAVPFLEDTRAATSDLIVPMDFGTNRIRTEVGDVAAATIAMMSGLDLNEVGFELAQPGPRDSFSFGEVGFMGDEGRAAVKKRIIELISDQGEKPQPLPD